MAYKIRNEKTGQLGWQVYARKSTARDAARFHAKFHGVKVSVVQENGQPCATRPKLEDGFSQMVRTFNFTCNAGR